MDKLRAQIHTLTLQLEDERDRHQTMVGTVSVFIDYAKSSELKYFNSADIPPGIGTLIPGPHDELGAFSQSPHPS